MSVLESFNKTGYVTDYFLSCIYTSAILIITEDVRHLLTPTSTEGKTTFFYSYKI